MPKSIPKGLTKEHVLRALADLDHDIPNPFGKPTGYELVYGGKHYPPKAVVGLAFRHLTRQILPPEEFSGGEAPGQANFVLRELGFVVEAKGDEGEVEPKEETTGRAWTPQEVHLIVADYFDMLRAELFSEQYSKAEHNRNIRSSLNNRSKASVEYKHQNISAVLVQKGLPYIDGYKPATNFQKTVLPQAVEAYLQQHAEFFTDVADGPVLNPAAKPTIELPNLDFVFDAPPDQMIVSQAKGKPWLTRTVREIDFARRDAGNRRLGKFGEEFVVETEKRRLLSHCRDDLARKVEWVAQTCGDGVGFDVLSFDEVDDSERYVEVKTTGLGKHFPFYVTVNEVRCSEDQPSKYRLYRVFSFSSDPRIYVLTGAISQVCKLEPIQYRAVI